MRQSQEDQTELTWIYGNPLGGDRIFFILQSDMFSSGAGLGQDAFSVILFCLLGKHMTEENIWGPGLSPLPPSAFTSDTGRVRP